MNIDTLFKSFSHLEQISMEESRLIKEVVIQLYTRIGISARVHPHDLTDYLIAWDYWKLQL